MPDGQRRCIAHPHIFARDDLIQHGWGWVECGDWCLEHRAECEAIAELYADKAARRIGPV